MSDTRADDDVADAFLRVVRERLDLADITYAEPPEMFTGGFFTENYAFALAGAPAEWSVPLVLRLFPREVRPEQVRREATVQRVLHGQGYPTPNVLLHEESQEPLGRAFLVMERVAAKSLMGGIALRELVVVLKVLARLPALLADTLAQLHAVDPAPFVEAMGDVPSGFDRWENDLRDIEADVPELATGARWLLDHRPEPRGAPVVCHGDLWPGNILASKGEVRAVIDWSVVSVAEPALDLGFATMASDLTPVSKPGPLYSVVSRLGRRVSRQVVGRYVERTGADLTNLRYHQALRTLLELRGVVEYRHDDANGVAHDRPRPTWHLVGDQVVAYFRDHTGVELTLPPPA
jgi:aminoglycoside phosphotransferase (APT) family kinase protein